MAPPRIARFQGASTTPTPPITSAANQSTTKHLPHLEPHQLQHQVTQRGCIMVKTHGSARSSRRRERSRLGGGWHNAVKLAQVTAGANEYGGAKRGEAGNCGGRGGVREVGGVAWGGGEWVNSVMPLPH